MLSKQHTKCFERLQTPTVGYRFEPTDPPSYLLLLWSILSLIIDESCGTVLTTIYVCLDNIDVG